jgi:enterochelin esterase-like enzyme
LQPAFAAAEAQHLAQMAKAAMEKNPKLKLRLLTSDRDFFLEETKAISKALSQAEVRHELNVVTGKHDYAFNRGPGGFEMLLYHDRVLRDLPAP